MSTQEIDRLETLKDKIALALTYLPMEEWQLYDQATLDLDELVKMVREAESTLRQERVKYHAANLELAITVAESDPAYMYFLRPQLKQIAAMILKDDRL